MRRWITQRVWPALLGAGQGWSKYDGGTFSAAMAYYAAFSLFPLLLLLSSALGFVLRFSGTAQSQQRQLIEWIAGKASPWLAQQLHQILVNVQLQASIGAPLGLITLLIATLGIFQQFQSLFDRIGGEARVQRGWLGTLRAVFVERLVSFLMLIAIGVFLVAMFVADNALAGVRSYVDAMPGGHAVWRVTQSVLTTAVYTFLLGLIFRIFPRKPVRWRDALTGGLLAAITWKAGQTVLEAVVIGQKYNSVYGVVGALLAVMLWIYYASAVFFFAANFVQELCRDCPKE
jgi:membrane protein